MAGMKLYILIELSREIFGSLLKRMGSVILIQACANQGTQTYGRKQRMWRSSELPSKSWPTQNQFG